MDGWTGIGFVQWSCGRPVQWIGGKPFPDERSICHNHETVCFYQIVNIIRTLCGSFEFLSRSLQIQKSKQE